MDVQCVERIADLMRDTGRQQCEGLDALALDGLKGFLPRFGCVVQDQRDAGTAPRFTVQRRGVKPKKTRTRIKHLEFMP